MSNQNGKVKVFSMFSGIGGFELGIIDAIGTRADFVAYSEIDKYAIKVYERHFDHEQRGDATNINPKDLPDFELLVGGFPCQAFSVAGKRGGFDDTRGTLFFDIARIVREKRPRHILLENVKGLLSHDKGKTLQTIIGVLTDIGYRVEWQVLNSKHHGVPQNRERIFIVGHLRGECGRQVFPIIGTDGEVARHKKDLVVKPAKWHRTEKGKELRREAQQNGRDYTPFSDGARELVPSDKDHVGAITSQAIAKDSLLFEGVKVKEATTKGYDVATEGDSINFSQPNSKTRRGRVGKGVANTLETSNTQATLEGAKIRRLTPKECERLQGFPDNWTALGIGDEEISDTQRYKMCGNAVTVNVIERIVTEMKDCLALGLGG